MGSTPVGAVCKEHVGAFRSGNINTLKVPVNVITGKVYVAAQYFAEFIGPFIVLRLISTKQSVHGQNIHHIIMAQTGLL